MESQNQNPTYGSREATLQNVEGSKTGAPDVYDTAVLANRMDSRLGDGGAVAEVVETAESRTARLSDMAHSLGGMTLSGEIADPRI